MRDGRIVARHERADVPVRTVVEQMVGRSVERMFPPLAEPSGEVLLQVEDLSSPVGSFSDVSFSVEPARSSALPG